MSKNTKSKQIIFIFSIVLTLCMLRITTDHIIINLNSSNPDEDSTSTPINLPSDIQFEINELPNYPAFTGEGTLRTAQESLWGYIDLGSKTAPYSFTVDLPGTTKWAGNRLDVSIGNIYEEQDWIKNGIFDSTLNPWIKNETSNPDISMGVDVAPKDPLHGEAAYFQFHSESQVATSPPQTSSTDPNNTGDVGDTTHWSSNTWYGSGGTPTTSTNNRDGATNVPGLSENSPGAWKFYIADQEPAGGNDKYWAYFEANYTFDLYYDPIESADFSFWSRYYSNNFDQGEGHSGGCTADTDADEFQLYYTIYYIQGAGDIQWSLGWVNAVYWGPASGNVDPGWGSWTKEIADSNVLYSFMKRRTGTFVVSFILSVYMDVNDGLTQTCDIWGCSCGDNNIEDAHDELTFWIDGLEFTVDYTSTFDDTYDPDITLYRGDFSGREAYSGSALEFDIYVPEDFFIFEDARDDELYLRITINNRTVGEELHLYSLSSFTTDDWDENNVIEWDTGYGGLWRDFSAPYNEPGTLTVKIGIDFGVSGWYAKNEYQSIWIDNVEFTINDIIDAQRGQVKFYDDSAHGNVELTWNYTSVGLNTLSYTRTGTDMWQYDGIPSIFLLNRTSNADITFYDIKVTFYAAPLYPNITPTFNVGTDETGRIDNVTWTIKHDVLNIYSPPTGGNVIEYWSYNLTIPNIANWDPNLDWDVVNIIDANSDPVNWQEIFTSPNFKNISIYVDGNDYNDRRDNQAEGTWTVTCHSPNRITFFDVVDKDDNTTWEYYPAGENRSRIKFTTGQVQQGDANISIYYLDPDGIPLITPQYFNSSILPDIDYTGPGRTPYWNIPEGAKGSDNYVAMVKWVDNGSGQFIDEIGFAAHYIQVKRNITVSNINFLHSGLTTNYAISGEELEISVTITDPLLTPNCNDLDGKNITFYFPSHDDPYQIANHTIELDKAINKFYYDLDTSGEAEPGEWPVEEAFMGMVGNISFIIDLYGDSTFINGQYEYYQLSGWFHIIVDTKYDSAEIENADDPTQGASQEQGSFLLLNVSLIDVTYGHGEWATNIIGSYWINNRSSGIPISDLYPVYPQSHDGIADTWNGTVRIQWALAYEENITSWEGENGDRNLPDYKWNGTLLQVGGEPNLYSTYIKIPQDAYTTAEKGTYWINITTTLIENEWGWASENISTILPFGVVEAQGKETGLSIEPETTQYYYWKNSTQGLTRFWIRYYDEYGVGFNSTFLENIESFNGSWFVKSYAKGFFTGLPTVDFGRSWNPIFWNHCKADTLLPDGITPDPHAENLTDEGTWGWFYHDYNWTKAKLPEGTFENPIEDQQIQIGITADIVNETDYQKNTGTFNLYIKPNDIELSFPLQYAGDTTFLDENYYGAENMTESYYWGDILNFTIDTKDIIENHSIAGINLRYRIKKSLSAFTIEGQIYETAVLGRYSVILNTSDPANGLTAGTYNIWFKGLKSNYSIIIESDMFELEKRDTYLLPEQISGAFLDGAVGDYSNLWDIINIDKSKSFDPDETLRTVPNETLRINVSLYDMTNRNGGPIYNASIQWILKKGVIIRMSGWINTSTNGIFELIIDLHDLDFDFSEYEDIFHLDIVPYKDNYESEDAGYPGGSTWDLEIRIGLRPIALIPITPISMSYSQSNWVNHPIQFAAMDLISGENISGVTINWRILGLEGYEGTNMVEYAPGYYQVTFNTWPSLFEWVKGGIYHLEAEIMNVPGGIYGLSTTSGWYGIPNLHGTNGIVLVVESEGFLGPLSLYFYIILGAVGAVIGAYYSYKSYKFLTTPYVIRKIEESIDKISKNKKIATGVMKSREHLIFLEATELLQIVGVALKPPPEKKLPPPFVKVIMPLEEIEKIPEIPMDIISAELDKAGVRPEEKPILIQQIAELGPRNKRELIESLIGEERFKELIENLKLKEAAKESSKPKKK